LSTLSTVYETYSVSLTLPVLTQLTTDTHYPRVPLQHKLYYITMNQTLKYPNIENLFCYFLHLNQIRQQLRVS